MLFLGFDDMPAQHFLNASSGEPLNAIDGNWVDAWETDSDTEHTISFDSNDGNFRVDYLGLGFYDLPEGADFQYSLDGLSYFTELTIPAGTGRNFIAPITARTARFWRLRSTGAANFAQEIRDIKFGLRFEIHGQRPGYTPPSLSPNVEDLSNLSGTGLVSGTSYIDNGVRFSFTNPFMPADEAYGRWLDFINHIKAGGTFYYYHDTDCFTESVICQADGRINPAAFSQLRRIDHSIGCRGFLP